MYRVFLFITILAYCSSAAMGPQKTAIIDQDDESELVDNVGAGYSYFKKQQVDTIPLVPSPAPISRHDLSAYMQASAFKNPPARHHDHTQMHVSVPNGYDAQRPHHPLPSPMLSKNAFGQVQERVVADSYNHGNARTMGSHEFLLPQTNLNVQHKTLSGYGSQPQHRVMFEQPQSSWSSQPRSNNFGANSHGMQQAPRSDSFRHW